MSGAVPRRYLVTIGAGYLVGALLYAKLPGPYFAATPDSIVGGAARPLLAFLLPTTAVVVLWLARRVWVRDAFPEALDDRDASFERSLDDIFFAATVFMTVLHAITIVAMSGILPADSRWLTRGTLALLGLAAIRVGNVLPRIRPNLVFGIRTRRLLADRRRWMLMHRTAGYVTVAVGTVVVVSAAFVSGPYLDHILGTSAVASAIVLFASYWRCSHVPSIDHV